MRRYYYRYRQKSKKIIGVTLCAIGFIIIIYYLPIELILLIIGLGLLIMGGLILKIK
ncbi:MAG: hypothetical protein WCZ27_03715 [Tissierellaceae bacterium]